MFEAGSMTTTAALETLVAALSRVDGDVSDGERVAQLTVLERVKSACAAAQVRVTADFVDSQAQVAAGWRDRAAQCAGGNDFEGWRAAREQARRATLTPEADQGVSDTGRDSGRDTGRGPGRRPGSVAGVAGQVALARRESPHHGAAHVGMAVALVRDMPQLLAALEAGTVSEWRAQLLVRETTTLTREQRRAVDAELHDGLGEQVGLLGDRELVRRVRAICYRLDAAAVLARCRAAQEQRRVSIRPAPDTMAYVTALLPVVQGVAVYAALTAAADTARAAGDVRGKGQVMADTLVTRVTGQATAQGVPVEVQVVMTDRALLAEDETPAQVPGYGPVPAGWARDLLTPNATAADTPAAGAETTGAETTGAGTTGAETTGAGTTGAGTTGAGTTGAETASAETTSAGTTGAETASAGTASAGTTAAETTDTRTAGAGRTGTVTPANGFEGAQRAQRAQDVRGAKSGAGSAGAAAPMAAMPPGAQVWLRRLYTHPGDGTLVAMDSTRRVFDGALRTYLLARDGRICRTPWCDAPVRHLDHVQDHARGGPTSASNGQGLCVRCNLTKQLTGWRSRLARLDGDDRHTVELTTPTGHTYRSHAPPVLPGLPPDDDSPLERHWQRLPAA